MMNWKGFGRKQYPGIYLEELRKVTKNLSQDSRSQGRDLNPGPLQYEADGFQICRTDASVGYK
jgi:hypothetical protein